MSNQHWNVQKPGQVQCNSRMHVASFSFLNTTVAKINGTYQVMHPNNPTLEHLVKTKVPKPWGTLQSLRCETWTNIEARYANQWGNCPLSSPIV